MTKKEISEFYQKNEKQIKKWKSIFGKQKEDSNWRSLIDLRKRLIAESYIEIHIPFNRNEVIAELCESHYWDDDCEEESFGKFSFKRGLEKKDLDIATSLLYKFVLLGGVLGELKKF